MSRACLLRERNEDANELAHWKTDSGRESRVQFIHIINLLLPFRLSLEECTQKTWDQTWETPTPFLYHLPLKQKSGTATSDLAYLSTTHPNSAKESQRKSSSFSSCIHISHFSSWSRSKANQPIPIALVDPSMKEKQQTIPTLAS